MNSNKPLQTILILGVNSFVGSNLAEFFKNDYKVVGTYFSNPISIEGILTIPCNVLNKDEVQVALLTAKADFVFYCVGLSSIEECSVYPHNSEALNTTGVYNVAEIAPRYNSRLIYFSTHHVFSGIKNNYNEVDNIDVITQYGKSVASTEFYLQKSSLNYLIIRCCKLYGRSMNFRKLNWFEAIEKATFKNNTIECDHFIKQGFIDVYYLGMTLKLLLDRNIQNRLVQLSSQNTMTHYEFAQTYASVFKVSDRNFTQGKWPIITLTSVGTQVVEDNITLKLDVLNLEGLLKIKLPTIKESLEFTKERLLGKSYLKERLKITEQN